MTITRTDLAAELAATHDITTDAAREAVDVYAEQLGDLDSTTIGDHLTDGQAGDIRRALTAQMAVDVGGPLDAVADATNELHQQRIAAEAAEAAWRASIRAALAAGQRVVDIARVADISRERVYQIRDDRR